MSDNKLSPRSKPPYISLSVNDANGVWRSYNGHLWLNTAQPEILVITRYKDNTDGIPADAVVAIFRNWQSVLIDEEPIDV